MAEIEERSGSPSGSPTITTAPAIDTQRLSLRGHRVEDFGDSLALWGDPLVTRYIGGKPLHQEEVWTRLLRYAGHWSLLGFGYWVVREKASGRFAGEVGLAEYQRVVEPSFDGAPEAGWILAPWAHGRGFATEAMRAVLAWATSRFGSRPTVCMISPENLPSIRVAERLGYRPHARTTYQGAPIIIYIR